jgi:ribonucleoside-diphosphate reductase alpha chain
MAFTSFNISVKISDAWMRKLASGGDGPHVVRNPRTGQRYLLPRGLERRDYTIGDLKKYAGDALSPGAGRRFYSVREIWKTIVKCAHATGEPGIAFIDRMNRDNPTPSLGEIEATNPCGEQPLLPYEACTLGSINLAGFVNAAGEFDWDRLGQAVSLAVRFLDDMLDACSYPVRNSVQLAQANRKIGLGVMGFADCLLLMGIPYDSDQGVEFGRTLMGFVNKTARQASCRLADMRGPFPNWNQSTWRTERNMKVRNAAITCVAPTGTISIIADCSSGIEPLYSPVFVRQVLDGRKLVCVNPVFRAVMQKHGIYDAKLEQRVLKSGTVRDIKKIPAGVRRVFRCAYDVAAHWHIRMQAAFQENCDAAVSKTINFPANATVSAIDKAFMLAYELGCKGITAYRRGSRPDEPMSLC